MTKMIALWCQAWAWFRTMEKREAQRGSVTMENVIWALAVIAIAAVVVGAITAYVKAKSGALLGP